MTTVTPKDTILCVQAKDDRYWINSSDASSVNVYLYDSFASTIAHLSAKCCRSFSVQVLQWKQNGEEVGPVTLHYFHFDKTSQ